MPGGLAGGKDAVVTVIALVEADMELVAEDGRSGLLHLEFDLLGRKVAALTFPLD